MRAERRVVVCFANAQLPDTDYRVAFARQSIVYDVVLALPARPNPIHPDRFEEIRVGAGLSARSFRALFRIPGILLRRRASVAMFFATQFCIFGPPLARLVGVTPVITVTGLGRSFSSNRLMRMAYVGVMRLNIRLCPVVLFQNPDDMSRLLEHLPSRLAPKCHLIGSGIDISYFVDDKSVPRDPRRCVLVARLMPAKGVDDFLRLARHFKGELDFVVVGASSDSHPGTLADVKRASAEGLIEYRGELSSAGVRQELRRSAVMVLASRAEGLPRVALEAALSGCAVLGYDIPGTRAALGLDYPLIPPWDYEELQSRLGELVTKDCVREALLERAHQHVLATGTAEAYVRRLEALLR